MTKSLWLSLLPSILADIDRYCAALRVEAIRAILAAQQKVSMSKLSKNPNDYPQSLYPDTFFNLATSLFSPHWSANSKLPQAYPSVGVVGLYTWRGKGTFGQLAEARTTSTIQAMVKAAGLDSTVATAAELDALGRRFTWDNAPDGVEQDKLVSWSQLVRIIFRSCCSPFKVDSSMLPNNRYKAFLDVDRTGQSTEMDLQIPKFRTGLRFRQTDKLTLTKMEMDLEK